MTITDPMPAALAMPGGEEPLSEEQLEGFARDALALAEEAGLDPEAAAELLWLKPEELGVEPAEGEEPPPLSPIQRFEIHDDGLAEWAMRKLAAIEAEEAEVAERAEGWIAEIRSWAAERQRPLAARRAFFEGALTAYLRELREESDGKIKSRKLPSGTIKSSSSSAKPIVADEEALIAWADEELTEQELEAVVKTTRKVLVGELRKIAGVSQRLLGERISAQLECGHALQVWIPAEGEKPLRPVAGEPISCPSCEPEFGEQPERMIESTEAEEIFEPCVRDEENGQVIPGAAVEPASISFSVKVGG